MNDASRVVQWNVTLPMIVFMYATMVLALAVFAYGIWRYLRRWRIGKPIARWNRPGERFRRVMIEGFGHRRLLRDRVPGAMHALIFFGFAILFLATVLVAIDFDLKIPILHGALYLYFESLTVDVFGFLAMIGFGIAAYRRYVRRLPRLEQGQWADAALLGSLALILFTGFLMEGLRITATRDPWSAWSPVGHAFAVALAAFLITEPALRAAHAGLWVFHVALWHTLLAVIPFTKLAHIVTSPANIFFADLDNARGQVPPIDFENPPDVLGVKTPFDLTWQQLLSLDACTECGRCQDACPAHAEGKPLSPKRLILDLRDEVRAREAVLLAAQSARASNQTERFNQIVAELPALGGGVIKSETLWACTTCRACEVACPVRIEHVPLILQLRQNLAMDQAVVPEGVAEAVQSLEVRRHPFRGASAERGDWYRDQPVVEMAALAEPKDVEVLYWVGCAGATDVRAQSIARSMVKIMHRAGVSFALLGPEEQCCGDPARRTGNEFHWDMLARANVATLQRYQVKRIVAHCPHCLQTLRHEYRKIGGDFEVIHHGEFVRQLLANGRLQVTNPLNETVAFHDPCYLGRYNGEFDAPRDVIDRLGARRVEMVRARERSFCCGAGGGHAFFEDASGGRVNQNRAREAVATGASTLSTGCPFCLAMLEDGVKSVKPPGRDIRVRDFVELVAEAIGDRA